MLKYIKRIGVLATSLISLLYTIIPETFFLSANFFENASADVNALFVRILIFVSTFVLISIAYGIYILCRQTITIKGENYCIKISYGDIFKTKNAKKVIPFDECYTTSVGELPAQIKPSSICGQYLERFDKEDIQGIIDNISIKALKSKSKYNNATRFQSGTIIPNGDYLLLAFAKLDPNGLGRMTYEEYIDSLNLLWQEIDKYYSQSNICIPILGAGITRIGDITLTQQELLNIIINSYKLSRHKLKLPAILYITCRKNDGFSINNIEI